MSDHDETKAPNEGPALTPFGAAGRLDLAPGELAALQRRLDRAYYARAAPVDVKGARATVNALRTLLGRDVSPGPWFVIPEREVDGVREGWPGTDTICHGDEGEPAGAYAVAALANDNLREGDARLIAALRNAAPLLLDLAGRHMHELEESEARMARLDGMIAVLEAKPRPPVVDVDLDMADRMLADDESPDAPEEHDAERDWRDRAPEAEAAVEALTREVGELRAAYAEALRRLEGHDVEGLKKRVDDERALGAYWRAGHASLLAKVALDAALREGSSAEVVESLRKRARLASARETDAAWEIQRRGLNARVGANGRDEDDERVERS